MSSIFDDTTRAIRSRGQGVQEEPAPLALLDRQRRALEMVVRGEPLSQVLQEICHIIEAVAPDRVAAAISLVEEGRLVHGAAPSLSDAYNALIDGIPVDPGLGTCPVAAATGHTVITEDIASEPRWAPFSAHPLADGWQAVWSMPIRDAGGEVIATIGTYFNARRAPTSVELELVAVLAGTAALAIERTRADENIRRQNARNAFLAMLEASIRNLDESAAIIGVAASRLGEFLNADRCAYATAETGDQLLVRGSYSRDLPPVEGSWPLHAFGPAFSGALLAGETHVVCDTDADLDVDPDIREAFLETRVRAAITVPLLKADRLSAIIAVHQAEPRRWKAHEIEVAEQVVARCWEAVERTRVTAALRSSEERYRKIVQSTPECVKLVGRDGSVLQMNDAGLRMLEADSPDELVGRKIFNNIAPEFRAAYLDLHAQVCGGETRTLQYELIGLKGTRRWMSTTAVPMAMPDGETAHLAITRDVTEQVAADAELEDSRARLDYAVRLSGIGFWYCDLPFDELNWDERVKAHFWLPPDARVTIDTFFERIHPDDREATRAAIALSNETGSPYDVYYRTCEPGGDGVKWIRALGGTAFDAHGKPIRFDGVTVDVTAQKSSEAESRRIAARLQEADRRKDEFLAMLAHELRNPLAPIGTAAQLLKRASNEPEQTAEAANIIERQVAHLSTIVDDLLDVSRVTRGLVEIERKTVDLQSVARAALEQVQPLLRARQHELRTVSLAADAFVVGDYHRLVQVLTNLLTNAGKYTPPEGVITLEVGSNNGDAIIKVSDNGVGIADELLDSVFELFTQAERTPDRTQGGLGIGLALVRSLVHLHGGSVVAQSEGLNRGSTFTVRLPLSHETDRPDGQAATASDTVPTRPRRVLVVDDNQDAAATLAAVLQLVGHTVGIANDAVSALAEASRSNWDTYVLDIGLPDMTGFELAERLKAGPASADATFIALTGYGQPHDLLMSRGAGFDHHMVKPPDITALLRILEVG